MVEAMGRTRIVLLITSLLLTTLLSGCTFEQGADGQSAIGPGTVSYQGASDGTQTSKPLSCDTSGKVNVNYQGSGSLKVVVRDGSGSSIYAHTYSVNGQGSDTNNISGKAGGWTISVERGGASGGSIPDFGSGTQQYTGSGFSGQYNANIAC